MLKGLSSSSAPDLGAAEQPAIYATRMGIVIPVRVVSSCCHQSLVASFFSHPDIRMGRKASAMGLMTCQCRMKLTLVDYP